MNKGRRQVGQVVVHGALVISLQRGEVRGVGITHDGRGGQNLVVVGGGHRGFGTSAVDGEGRTMTRCPVTDMAKSRDDARDTFFHSFHSIPFHSCSFLHFLHRNRDILRFFNPLPAVVKFAIGVGQEDYLNLGSPGCTH